MLDDGLIGSGQDEGPSSSSDSVRLHTRKAPARRQSNGTVTKLVKKGAKIMRPLSAIFAIAMSIWTVVEYSLLAHQVCTQSMVYVFDGDSNVTRTDMASGPYGDDMHMGMYDIPHRYFDAQPGPHPPPDPNPNMNITGPFVFFAFTSDGNFSQLTQSHGVCTSLVHQYTTHPEVTSHPVCDDDDGDDDGDGDGDGNGDGHSGCVEKLNPFHLTGTTSLAITPCGIILAAIPLVVISSALLQLYYWRKAKWDQRQAYVKMSMREIELEFEGDSEGRSRDKCKCNLRTIVPVLLDLIIVQGLLLLPRATTLITSGWDSSCGGVLVIPALSSLAFWSMIGPYLGLIIGVAAYIATVTQCAWQGLLTVCLVLSILLSAVSCAMLLVSALIEKGFHYVFILQQWSSDPLHHTHQEIANLAQKLSILCCTMLLCFHHALTFIHTAIIHSRSGVTRGPGSGGKPAGIPFVKMVKP